MFCDHLSRSKPKQASKAQGAANDERWHRHRHWRRSRRRRRRRRRREKKEVARGVERKEWETQSTRFSASNTTWSEGRIGGEGTAAPASGLRIRSRRVRSPCRPRCGNALYLDRPQALPLGRFFCPTPLGHPHLSSSLSCPIEHWYALRSNQLGSGFCCDRHGALSLEDVVVLLGWVTGAIGPSLWRRGEDCGLGAARGN